MKALAIIALILFNLSNSTALLPDAWETSLWHTSAGQVKAERVNDAGGLPVQPKSSRLELGAKGVIAIDRKSGTVLFAKNPDTVRPIASLVKLTGAILSVSKHSLDETVTIKQVSTYPDGAVMLNLAKGQKFKLSQLLAASLIPSANDAADALAIHHSGSVSAFAAEVETLLKEWGISDVKIADASGLSSKSQASPAALAKVAELALTNVEITQLVDKSEVRIKDLKGRSYPFGSTNRLLSDPAYDGVKTGYTAAAGQSVISLVEIEGHEVITVILNSPDRFAETERLVDYLKKTWEWQ